MSKERIKQLLEEASEELKLIQTYKDEKDLEIIINLKKGAIHNLEDIPDSIKKNKDGFKQILKSPYVFAEFDIKEYFKEHGGVEFCLRNVRGRPS